MISDVAASPSKSSKVGFQLQKRPNSIYDSKIVELGGNNEALDIARMNEHFFEMASRGSKADIERMKLFLLKDPKANFYQRSDDNHLINRRNFLG